MSRKKNSKNIKELEDEIPSNADVKITSKTSTAKSKKSKGKSKKDSGWGDSDEEISHKKITEKSKPEEEASVDKSKANSITSGNKAPNKSKKNKKTKKNDDWSDDEAEQEFKLPSDDEEPVIAKPVLKKKGRLISIGCLKYAYYMEILFCYLFYRKK